MNLFVITLLSGLFMFLPAFGNETKKSVSSQLRQLVKTYQIKGRTEKDRNAIVVFFEQNKVRFQQEYWYLEEQIVAYSVLDDDEKADKLLLAIPLDKLENPINRINSIRRTWQISLEATLRTLEKLLDDSPVHLNSFLHDSLVQVYLRDQQDIKEKADTLLSMTQSLPKLRDHRLLAALILWREMTAHATDADNLKSMATRPMAPGWAHLPRYRLLIYPLLSAHSQLKSLARDHLDQTVRLLEQSLEQIQTQSSANTEKNSLEQRAYHRFLLSHAYYLKSQAANVDQNQTETETYLRKAADFSPDAQDLYVGYAYFYEKVILNTHETFIPQYCRFLAQLGKNDQALSYLTQQAVSNHTLIDTLKTLYSSFSKEENFKAYWIKALSTLLPTLHSFTFKTLDDRTICSTEMKGRWTLLDFWGSWCTPCVEDLPLLSDLYRKTQDPQAMGSYLQIYTFACHEKAESVKKFMAEKKYDFPVSMAEDALISYFQVMQYPTKILITPDGHYTRINTREWTEFLKAFLQTES